MELKCTLRASGEMSSAVITISGNAQISRTQAPKIFERIHHPPRCVWLDCYDDDDAIAPKFRALELYPKRGGEARVTDANGAVSDTDGVVLQIPFAISHRRKWAGLPLVVRPYGLISPRVLV
jgi:hypothetical protein